MIISENNLVKECLNNVDNVPLTDGIEISTITINCGLKLEDTLKIFTTKIINTKFDIMNIALYFDISNLYKIEHFLCTRINNKLHDKYVALYNKKKHKKKIALWKKHHFYNQVTLIKLGDNNITNIKIFTNGSIQMAGCISVQNAVETLDLLLEKMNKRTCIRKNGKFVETKFITKYDILSRFSVSMINSTFNIGFKVNRNKLYEYLKLGDYDLLKCVYDPTNHAGVIIQQKCSVYNNKVSKVSIFVFESGKIIITGAKTNMDIINCHRFISNILIDNKNFIKLINKSDILNLIRERPRSNQIDKKLNR